MGNMTTAFIFVMALNLIMWLTQASMLNLAIEYNAPSVAFMHCNETVLGLYSSDCENYVPPDDRKVDQIFPSNAESTSPSTGNIFTDVFNSIKGWFLDVLGLKYIIAIVSAPMVFLKIAGVDPTVANMIGTVWYGLTTLMVIVFMWWRD